jgi:hypothetical protein
MAHENPRNVDVRRTRVLDRARGRPDIADRFSGPGYDIGNRPEQNQSDTSQNSQSSSHESLLNRMPAGLEYRTCLRKALCAASQCDKKIPVTAARYTFWVTA